MKKTKKDTSLDFNSGWSYAPAPESTDHVRIKPQYELFINGEFTAPSSGKYFDTISPSSEKKLASVAEANENARPETGRAR